MTRLRGGQPTALALLLALAACTTSQRVVGPPPETEPAPADPRRARSDAERAEKIRKHQEAEARAEPQVEEPKKDEPRVGVATTRVFHRPECKLLEGVPTVDQLRFTSPWDAVDSRYAPCPECKPFQ